MSPLFTFRRCLPVTLLWLLTLVLPSGANAQFSGAGAGTANDPYLIFNPAQLNQVRNYVNGDAIHPVYFQLGADIDMTTWISSNHPIDGWIPIGTTSAPFRGVLDGNGHCITGLRINRPSTENVGLFGCIERTTISNLSVAGDVIGGTRTGLLVGYADLYSTIQGVHTEGKVTGKEYTGGIAGEYNTGNMKECSSKSTIEGSSRVGGLIGKGKLKMDDCFSCTNIIASGSKVGGILGEHWPDGSSSTVGLHNILCTGTIVNTGGSMTGGIIGYSDLGKVISCAAICNISAKTTSAVGGIVGECHNGTTSIEDCYFTGDIVGDQFIGGITGKQGSITRCYAKGSLTGNTDVGGISGYSLSGSITKCFAICDNISALQSGVGRIYAEGNPKTGQSGTLESNYSLVDTRVLENGVEIPYFIDAKNGDTSSLSTMKMRATYQGLGWDFSNDWNIQETECLPYMVTQTAPPIVMSNPSAGSLMVSGKSINNGTVFLEYLGQVYSTQAMNNTWTMRTDPLKAGERLTIWTESDDLFRSYNMIYTVGYSGSGTEEDPWQIYTVCDLSNICEAGYYKLMNDIDLTGIDWEPIGSSTVVMITFDGDDHIIKGLNINQTTSYCGLFTSLSKATVKNLIIDSANIKGSSYSGVLAGLLTDCVISNVTVGNAQVKGSEYTGILTGSLTGGTVSNVSVNGEVVGDNYTGGLTGKIMDNATVSLCNVNGTVMGGNYTGGLVGYSNEECIISRSCTSGNIKSTGENPTYYVGGICGYNAGHVSDCFSQAEVTGGYIGGITGINYGEILRCYAAGDLLGSTRAAGISGYNDGGKAVIDNCAVAMDRIRIVSQTGNVMRIVGGVRNGSPLPDVLTNLAYQSMVLSVNGVSQEIWDDPMNGTGVTGDALRTQSTYTKMGWLFPSVWRINGSAMPELVGLDGAGTSRTDNYMYADAQSSAAGEIFELSINLRNKDIGTTFQFDMLLPEGMDIYEYYDEDEEEDVLSIEKGARLTRTHALVWKRQPNGAMRVLCTSARLEPMIGDDGEIVKIKVKVGDNVVNGRHTIRMTNVMLDSEGTNIFMNNFTIPVTILNDRVYAGNAEVMRGKSTKLSVVLDNKSVITGFQFDVYLPVGARIVTDVEGNPEIGLTERCEAAHALVTKQIEDGATRVIVYAADAQSKLSGNDGAIAELNVETDADMAEGVYDVIFKNVYLANAEFKSVECADFMSALTVTRVRRKGDVNTDGIITSADISAGMGISLSRGNEIWDQWAADIDDDGTVRMNDTKEITYLALDEVFVPRVHRKAPVGGEVVSPDDPNADLDYNGTYDFYYRPFTIEPGGETMVDLCLDNPTKVSGIQWDIRLPEGMSFVYEDREVGPDDLDPIWYEEAERSANFMLGCVAHPEKGIYSLMHLNIAAGNYKKKTGAILTFKVQADESVAPGVYTGYIENLVVMDDMDVMYRGKCEPFSIVVGDISEAEHLELNGRPDEIFAEDMAEVLAGNADLLSLDLTGVLSMPEGTAFTGGNANTVVYVDSEADRALTANTNVVIDGVCERLVLTDGHPFGVDREFTATEAVYTREMKAGEVASLYLPFKADEPVDAEYRVLEAVDFDTKSISHLAHSHSAYEACLVLSATEGVKEFRADNVVIAPEAALEAYAAADGGSQMFGSLTHSTVDEPVYTVEDGMLTETSKLEPFRGYVSSDFETAVKQITVDDEDKNLEIYTVTGIRVRRDLQELQPGIYIVGGRKIMVK